MSFLQRSRSLGPNSFPSSSENVPSPSVPFPPGPSVENIQVASRSQARSSFTRGRKIPAEKIIRRVSTMLSKSLPKKPSALSPRVLNIQAQQPMSQWKVINRSSSPTESDISFDDIRRPSGLGRAISISSNRSLPPSPFTVADKDSPFRFATKNDHERTRALSSPHSHWSTEALEGVINNKLQLQRSVSITRRNKACPPPPMPHEVLINILTFASRHTVASSALSSRDWYAAARLVLYQTLDLRTLAPEKVKLLVTLLAYRHDLAELVRSFECHTWPDFFPPSSNLDEPHTPHPSFSPALTAVFTIAFQNMHLVTSLVLPSFDHTFLRHHSAFGLRKLTIISHAMSSNETAQLFAWLDGQTNITHLAFPNLLDLNNTLECFPIPKISAPDSIITNTCSTSTPVLTLSKSLVFPLNRLPSASPFDSPSLLPVLTTLTATPSISNSLTANRHLARSRPLRHITLNINDTLYTGLRPSSLLTPLRGITTLSLKFSNVVDRRTIAKILSAGAVLALSSSPASEGLESVTNHGPQGLLQELELVLRDSATGMDRSLYKAISASIARYQGLVRLNCRFTSGFSSEVISEKPPPLDDCENAVMDVWVSRCPSLQEVTLFSGAVWKRIEEPSYE
ncbi:hypothetical protein C0993_008985 [Termitomyces sp. T159_Od127]|nr:hypothetical protein C0993_008985 [Termitomyces sp. T159_Od127]